MDLATIRELDRYQKAGWVLVALPPDVASLIVGEPATQDNALAFSAHIKELKFRLEQFEGSSPGQFR